MSNGDLNWITNFIWGIADDVLSHAGGDPRRYFGVGEGDRRTALGNHRRRCDDLLGIIGKLMAQKNKTKLDTL
jgi:hypothetical protein